MNSEHIGDEAGSSGIRTAMLPRAQSVRWPAIEWDDDGYPVGEDDDFADYASLPLDFEAAARFLLAELPAAATQCCCWCEVTDDVDYMGGKQVRRITFSTGGWSGAESLIAFIERRMDTAHFMVSWRRGGHYVFEVPKRLLALSTPSQEHRE
jgi:hypothetical protein